MILHERERPGRSQLFVAVPDEDDVTIELNARSLQRDHGHEMHDAFALHVERAASPYVAVLHDSREWINTPEL